MNEDTRAIVKEAKNLLLMGIGVCSVAIPIIGGVSYGAGRYGGHLVSCPAALEITRHDAHSPLEYAVKKGFEDFYKVNCTGNNQ